MAEKESNPEKAKSDIVSPTKTQAEVMKTFGGMPKTLKVDRIEVVNSPGGRSRAPESAGF